MSKIVTTLLAILFICNTILGQNAKEIAKNCLSSTVSLVMEDNFKQPISLGSGFIIENGKIATNLHVIEGAKYGYVFVNGNSTKHKIQGYFSIDKQNDLAIISVPSITEKSLPLDTKTPDIGEKIYAIGNPKG
jgi:S1-C subfamily serine protease